VKRKPKAAIPRKKRKRNSNLVAFCEIIILLDKKPLLRRWFFLLAITN